jgi:hypothetical protein
MSEFVLITPLVVVILALLFYMGGLMDRAERMTQVPRYEVWRHIEQGTGPAADDNLGHPQLNQAFFSNKATAINHRFSETDSYFPDEPYTELIQDAGCTSDASAFINAFVYRPGNGSDYRLDTGLRNTFAVYHADASTQWTRASSLSRTAPQNPEETTPLQRQHVRIGTDWSYTNDWRASSPLWQDTRGTEIGIGHLRANRDAFYLSYDSSLDAIDGNNLPEYSDQPSGPQNVDMDSLAGLVRSMYLLAPGYRGPTVWNALRTYD